MSKEKFDAKVDQLAGGAKELLGKATGDKAVETEGKVEQVVGKAKEVAADAVDTIKGAVDALREHEHHNNVK